MTFKQKPNNNPQLKTELYPDEGQTVYFNAAIVYAKSIEKSDKLPRGSGAHRAQMAKVRDGYFLITKNRIWKKK
jgi:hypothetical protein